MKASSYKKIPCITQSFSAEIEVKPTKKELRHKLKRERERVRRIEKALTKQEINKTEI
jgi:hypothetical protein